MQRIDSITLEKIQNEISKQISEKKLYIMNGYEMYKELQYDIKEDMISWNEAMCWGDVKEEIFSSAFIEQRIVSLNSSKDEYQKIVLNQLKPLFENHKYTGIVTFFGVDMFCQMNLLTVLAFLKQVNYQGKVICCCFDEENIDHTIRWEEVNIERAKQAYIKIICQKEKVSELPFDEMGRAMDDYLSYRTEKSEIACYINEHIHNEEEELIHQMLTKFKRYGLGDSQYRALIHENKENKKIQNQRIADK